MFYQRITGTFGTDGENEEHEHRQHGDGISAPCFRSKACVKGRAARERHCRSRDSSPVDGARSLREPTARVYPFIYGRILRSKHCVAEPPRGSAVDDVVVAAGRREKLIVWRREGTRAKERGIRIHGYIEK